MLFYLFSVVLFLTSQLLFTQSKRKDVAHVKKNYFAVSIRTTHITIVVRDAMEK